MLWLRLAANREVEGEWEKTSSVSMVLRDLSGDGVSIGEWNGDAESDLNRGGVLAIDMANGDV